MKRNPPRRALPLFLIGSSLTKRMTLPLWFAIVFIGVSFGFANAQEGAIDPAFDVPFTTSGIPGFPTGVGAIAAQPDGKILVGGRFLTIGGKTRPGIARLNADGSADTTFDSHLMIGDGVSQIVVDNLGRILIRGSFRHLEGISRAGFARLRTDGSLDTSFNPPDGVSDFKVDILGRIYVTGTTISDGVNSRQGISRINPDGSIDSTFTGGISPNAVILRALIDPQNRIVLFGDFFNNEGIVRRGVVRLNADGTPDQTFTPYLNLKAANLSEDSFVIAADLNGRILLAPEFSTSNRILRLNLNGTPDTTFTQSALPSTFTGLPRAVGRVTFQLNGKIVLGSSFSTGTLLTRLNSDGTLDTTFAPPSLRGRTTALAIEPTGRILFGIQSAGIPNTLTLAGDLGRLNPDGILDPTFRVSDRAPGQVLTMVTDASGRILAGGRFTSCGTFQIPALARINIDGTVDTTFRPFNLPTGPSQSIPTVFSVALDANGKILVAGSFQEVGGFSRKGVARLNSDGSVDTTFNPGTGVDFVSDLKVAVDPTGKIYVGGPFTSFAGAGRPGLVRLNTDGSVDLGFSPSAGGVSFIVDGNGRIVVATDAPSLVRLNPDGSTDGTFTSAITPTSRLRIFLSPDNKILAGRQYTVSGGPTQSGIIRLNSDGSVDGSFNASINPAPLIRDFAPIANNKILVLQENLSDGGPRLFQLNADGSLDSGFQQSSIDESGIFAFGVDAMGRALLSVDYQNYEGVPRVSLIRLTSNACRATVTPLMAYFQTGAAGTGNITFTAPTSSCPWRAESDSPWITVNSSGSGSATIPYSVSANFSGRRTGFIRINNQVVNVLQEAGCFPDVTPSLESFNRFGGQGSFNVSCSSDCFWKIENSQPWLRLLGPTSGHGNATIPYQVLPNPGGRRESVLVVGGAGIIRIVQRGRKVVTPGEYRDSSGFFYQRNSTDTGFSDQQFFYGQTGDIPISGDWNGDTIDSVGIYRNGVFYLRNANSSGFADIQFAYGQPGDIPIAGDWDGDGVDTIGVIRGNRVLLRNSNTAGPADIDFNFGTDTDIFIAGDWNGDGVDTIGCFRPTNGFVFLRNSNTSGFADTEFFYGLAGDRPIAGDWDGDGLDTIGVVRGNRWLLRNSNTSGFADIEFNFGDPNDIPIVGDWNGTP